MMASDDIHRIHERIDGLAEKVESVNTTLYEMKLVMTRWVVHCESCRSVVMGDGGLSMDKRVDRLEQVETDRKRWFWIIVGGVPTLISGLLVMLTRWLWKT